MNKISYIHNTYKEKVYPSKKKKKKKKTSTFFFEIHKIRKRLRSSKIIRMLHGFEEAIRVFANCNYNRVTTPSCQYIKDRIMSFSCEGLGEQMRHRNSGWLKKGMERAWKRAEFEPLCILIKISDRTRRWNWRVIKREGLGQREIGHPYYETSVTHWCLRKKETIWMVR